MCFSATASFTASAVLMGTGVATIREAKTSSQMAFACIPMLFALQQGAEGVLWMALSNPAWAFLYQPAMHFYFFIAMAVWPLWVPLSLWLMETKKDARRKLRWSLDLGLLVFAYFAICHLLLGVQANADCFHIGYLYRYPFSKFAEGAYFLAVIPPFFLSSWKNMPIVGLTITLSLILAKLFFIHFVLSVWCFFAAVLSVQFLWVLHTNLSPKSRSAHSDFPKGSVPD